jgi:hypothetical protein
MAALYAFGAAAQTSADAPPAITVAAKLPVQVADDSILPANSEILLRLNSNINSRHMKFHHIFDLTVAKDVMLGDYVVIPHGTPATGYIAYRTGRGAFGKSAKIEIEMQWIHMNRELIPISGHYRQEGRGNTAGTVVAAVAFGALGGALVTGRSANIPQDTMFKAFTKEPIAVTFDAPVSARPRTAAPPAAATASAFPAAAAPAAAAPAAAAPAK